MIAARQTIGRAVAAAAVALVVVGSTVGIAAATARDDAVRRANDFILECFEYGGEPIVLMDSTGESITVICEFPNGNKWVCTFNPVTNCQEVRGISPELTPRMPVDGLPELSVPDPSGGSAETTAGPRLAAPDDHQKHAKGKNGKKGKKHGHGGKGRKK